MGPTSRNPSLFTVLLGPRRRALNSERDATIQVHPPSWSKRQEENGPKVARKKSLAHRLNLITQGSVAPKRAVALLFSQQAATPMALCPGPRQLPVAYPHAHIPGGKQPYVANAVLNG